MLSWNIFDTRHLTTEGLILGAIGEAIESTDGSPLPFALSDKIRCKIVCQALCEMDVIPFPMYQINRYKIQFTNPDIKRRWMKNPTMPRGLVVTVRQAIVWLQ